MTALPILPPTACKAAATAGEGSLPLKGVAALAAAATRLDPHRQVEFFELEAHSILTRCVSTRMPFTWTLNPYRGCEFGCQYCYARYAHEFLELRRPADFERKIFVKRRAAELLRRDLRRVKPGESIAIGTATDPYQPAERHFQVTRSLLEVFAASDGLAASLDLGLVTKSTLVARDAALLGRAAVRNRVVIRMTITTADPALARALEPRAPRPDLRLGALRRLREAGLTAGVICAPVMPGITDQPAQLERLIAAAAEAGAMFFHAGALFLQPAAQAQFLPFLEQRWPALAAEYRSRFASSAYLPREYQTELTALVARLASRYGLPTRAPVEPVPGPAQLTLF